MSPPDWGKAPSHRAARRSGLGLPTVQATQTGMRGFWTGVGGKGNATHMVVLASEGKELARPEAGQYVEAFVELFSADFGFAFLAEGLELPLGRVAEADA